MCTYIFVCMSIYLYNVYIYTYLYVESNYEICICFLVWRGVCVRELCDLYNEGVIFWILFVYVIYRYRVF